MFYLKKKYNCPPNAVRRLMWITPCKPQAQLGVETQCLASLRCIASLLPELRSSSTHYGVEGSMTFSLPPVSLGVIHILPLTGQVIQI
jgi:hypothetical protein